MIEAQRTQTPARPWHLYRRTKLTDELLEGSKDRLRLVLEVTVEQPDRCPGLSDYVRCGKLTKLVLVQGACRGCDQFLLAAQSLGSLGSLGSSLERAAASR